MSQANKRASTREIIHRTVVKKKKKINPGLSKALVPYRCPSSDRMSFRQRRWADHLLQSSRIIGS